MGSSTNPNTCVLCAGPLSATYHNGQHGSWVTWFCPMCDVQRTPTPTPPAPAPEPTVTLTQREYDALAAEAATDDDRKGEDGEAIFDARLYGKTRFVPSPVPGGPRMLDFDVLRAIGIAVAMRARDIPTSTPEQCVDAVLADLGIEKNPGPPALVQFESQIVFCRVCGKPPQQHPFGPCGD